MRVPMADVAPMKVPDTGMMDEEVLFLTDILPQAIRQPSRPASRVEKSPRLGDRVPSVASATSPPKSLGAERIIAIETVPERTAMARKALRHDIATFAEEDVFERIKEISKGEGADVVIDCVGMEVSPLMERAAESAP